MAKPTSPSASPPSASLPSAAAPTANAAAPAPTLAEPTDAADPSMEDILASIRRILSEDEASAEPTAPSTPGVLALDESMLVPAAKPAPAASPVPPIPAPPPAPKPAPEPAMSDTPEPPRNTLVAPEAAASASSSMGQLMRTLAVGRPQATPGARGVTLEDMVRDELRPLLKAWLDEHLPAVVERLVRTEIERVVRTATDG